MISKKEFFSVGSIVKTSGFEGDLILLLDVDDTQRYTQLTSVVVEVKGALNEYRITKYKLNNNNTATLHLENIDDFEQARNFIKATVFLPLSFLPVLTGNNFYFHEIIGFDVIDKHYGNIGNVESVVEMVHQNILQIKKDRKEILIPLKDEFILAVDRGAKTIHIEAPDGLIDIYLKPTTQQEEEDIDFNFDSSD